MKFQVSHKPQEGYNIRKSRQANFTSVCLTFCLAFIGSESAFGVSNVDAQPAFEKPITVGILNHKNLTEVSGAARSFHQPDHIWAINDSGDAPSLHLVSHDGKPVASINISELANFDWEDIDSFEVNGKPYLAIGDIGDNLNRRKVYYVHILPEPEMTFDIQGNPKLNLKPSDIQTIGFQFEDGARDSESIAVDPENKAVYILSKRDKPARLYRLPLMMAPERIVYKASFIQEVEELAGISPIHFGSMVQTFLSYMPTSMSTFEDEVAVLTYGYVHLFHQNATSKQKFWSWQKSMPLPRMPQAEALSYIEGGHLLVFSEQVPSPIVRFSRQPLHNNSE
ncbi:MAG: hypothetical protein V4629_02400 [Pseudomonadota bacterium]